MRNMSFMLTEPQILARSKFVTRRLGWLNLKAGEHFTAIRKGQGLKPGEKVVRLTELICVSNRRERLDAILAEPNGAAEEGFPLLTEHQFVDFFCREIRCRPSKRVSRIEFKYA